MVQSKYLLDREDKKDFLREGVVQLGKENPSLTETRYQELTTAFLGGRVSSERSCKKQKWLSIDG